MKKSNVLIVFIMLVVAIQALACSGSSKEEDNEVTTPEHPLLSFVFQCGEVNHTGGIDQTTRVVTVGGIRASSDITGVSYQLGKGAIITPDPKDVSVWEKTQEFTVRAKNGKIAVYTVNIPDLLEETEESQKGVVIGYLPASDWEFDDRFDEIPWEYLTHVNISFARARADGTLNTQTVPGSRIIQILRKAREHGLRVLISIQKNSSGEFKEALSNEETRNVLAKNIVKFTKDYQLDGFDIDYEDYEEWDAEALLAFAKALHAAKEEKMLMTCAVICWRSYTGEWHRYFDYINIMSYDRVQGRENSKPGQHAPFDFFTSNLSHWETAENAPKSKIVGGLPFYGYSWDSDMKKDAAGAVRYNAIINHFLKKGFTAKDIADHDQVNDTYYNGRPTIREKCQYVKEHGYGGVMIWQILQDAYQEELKLIHVIGEEMKGIQ